MEHAPPRTPDPGVNPESVQFQEALRGLCARVAHARAVSGCLLDALPPSGEVLDWGALNNLGNLCGALDGLLGLAEDQAEALETRFLGGDH
jgi:hypothetical protein